MRISWQIKLTSCRCTCAHMVNGRVVAAVHNWWTMVTTVSLYWIKFTISSFDPFKYRPNSPLSGLNTHRVWTRAMTLQCCEQAPVVTSSHYSWLHAGDGLVTCRQLAPGSSNQRLNYHLAGSLQRNSLIHIIHATAQQLRSCSGKYFCLQCL